MRQLVIVLLLTCVMLSGTAVAQTISSSLGIYVYPGDGQSLEQLAVDENECYQWAQQTTGVDPNNPMAGVQTQAAQQQSGPTGAAVRGAAKGALIGEVTDNDRSDYAAAGAVVSVALAAVAVARLAAVVAPLHAQSVRARVSAAVMVIID